MGEMLIMSTEDFRSSMWYAMTGQDCKDDDEEDKKEQRCNFCLNPESILTKETCCTGCSALIFDDHKQANESFWEELNSSETRIKDLERLIDSAIGYDRNEWFLELAEDLLKEEKMRTILSEKINLKTTRGKIMKCDSCKEVIEFAKKGIPITDICRQCNCNQPECSKREDPVDELTNYKKIGLEGVFS